MNSSWTGTPFALGTARLGWGVLVMVVVLAVLCGLFGDVLSGRKFFAFRDSMHFFPPLYRLVADEWRSGRVPLWNPWLNGGQPLAATNTAGVFYPPQLLLTWLLPDGVSLTVLMLVHLALAAGAAFSLARDEGASRPASLVAALCFAGSGCILFHIYAPNALTGAAWAAWAVRAGARLVDRITAADFLCLSASLALAVLSGDPQSAFNAGIVVGLLLWCRRRPTAVEPDGSSWKRMASRCGVLAAAAGLGAALSYVQLALTREFMLTTTRYTDVVPVSIWDAPGFALRSQQTGGPPWYAVLIGRPPAGVGFYHEIYRYSIAPWWILECLSPTLAGRFLSRWPHDLGWEGHAWVATLYAGIIPLACVLLALAAPSARRRSRGWTAALAFAYLAAIGGFGLVGMTRHALARATGAEQVAFYQPGDEVGGLYWLLVTFLPGYSGFRYPAKWLAVFALAFSQLAAVGFDLVTRDDDRRHRATSLYAALAGMSLLVTASATIYAGPATRFVLGGGLLAATVAAAACGVLVLGQRRIASRPVVSAVLVALVTVDLVIAGRCFMFVSPFNALVEGGSALSSLRELRRPELARAGGAPRLTAIDDLIGIPRSDDPRQRAMFTGMAMRSHTPLLHGWGKIGDPGTAIEADAELFFHAPRNYGGSGIFARRMFDAAAVEFFVIPRHPPLSTPLTEFDFDWSPAQKRGSDDTPAPAGERMPGTLALPPGMPEEEAFVKYVRNESALPRARIAGRIRRVDPSSIRAEQARTELLSEIAFPNPRIPALGTTVVVESAAPLDIPDRPADGPHGEEECRIVVDEPQRVVVEATLRDPGLVVLADTFHPDWHLTVRSDGGDPRAGDVLRVNRVHRGCTLPAGRHVLEFAYRSATFERTWPITAIAWIGLLTMAVVLQLRRAGTSS